MSGRNLSTARNLGAGSLGVLRAIAPGTTPASTHRARLRQIAEALPRPTANEAWLLLAVLGRDLPTSDIVEAAVRTARHQGTAVLLKEIAARRRKPGAWLAAPVDVLAGGILVDVQDTATTILNTGIQRVARAVAEDWLTRDESVVAVGWSPTRARLHALSTAGFLAGNRRGLFSRRAIAPWRGHYFLPESVNEPARSARIQALAEYSGARSAMIGHDAIPLTTAETTGTGMPGVFAKYLVAASRMQLVAATSSGSAAEYRGWRTMLASAGLAGPEIVEVPLAVTPPILHPDAEADARALFVMQDAAGDLPLVVCVGSHEPRKNHAAVLHASELLWREGARFSLTFVGGNAWGSAEFLARVDELRAAGRPVQTVSALPERLLGWSYRLATFTVFPSITEGFGLPIAESLGLGTPVITSGYGSMAEVAASGGAILVDPRDDASISAAMASLLADPQLRARLAAEAVGVPARSWAEYAGQLFTAVVKYNDSSAHPQEFS